MPFYDPTLVYHETRDPDHLLTWYPRGYSRVMVASHNAGMLELLCAPVEAGGRAWLIIRDNSTRRASGRLCASLDEARRLAEIRVAAYDEARKQRFIHETL